MNTSNHIREQTMALVGEAAVNVIAREYCDFIPRLPEPTLGSIMTINDSTLLSSASAITPGYHGSYTVRAVSGGFRVGFVYTDARLAEIKAIGGREYDGEAKTWFVPESRTCQLQALLAEWTLCLRVPETKADIIVVLQEIIAQAEVAGVLEGRHFYDAPLDTDPVREAYSREYLLTALGHSYYVLQSQRLHAMPTFNARAVSRLSLSWRYHAHIAKDGVRTNILPIKTLLKKLIAVA